MVTRPESYDAILAEMRANDGATLRDTRAKLALDVFQTTAAYDGAIAAWMGAQLEGEGSAQFPAERTLRLQKVQDLRYGENPHQAAAFYRRDGYVNAEHSLAHAKQHQGKELSYNNYLDLDAAWTAVREFDEPACVIVKHLTPCGVCQDDDLVAAYQRAHACDPVSAYGGVMAFNRPVTSDVVVAIFDNKQFVEAIIAPEFAGDALDMYSAKKNARLLSTGGVNPAGGEVEYRSVEGGLLCQDSDAVAEDPAAFTVPTKRQPTDEEMAELLFAWKVCKSIKSNAIAITKGHATIGVGGGQPNRVNSARIAVEQAGDAAANDDAAPEVPAGESSVAADTGKAFPKLTRKQLAIGAAIGLGAGLASGYVGVGGGFIMVPLMLSLVGISMKQASGTSLIAVMLLAIPGTIEQGLLGNIDYMAGIAVAVGSIPGAVIGARLVRLVPERTLRFIFGGFLIVAAVVLVLNEVGVL